MEIFNFHLFTYSLQKVNDVVPEDLPPPPPELIAADDSEPEPEDRGPPPVAVKPAFSSPVKHDKPPVAAKPNFIKPPEVPETLPPPPVSELYLIQCCETCVLYQGSHRLEKYLNLEGFLEKSLKIKSALKSTGKSLKIREKSLNSTIFCRLSPVDKRSKSV